MTFSTWLSLVATCLVLSLTPGAGAVNTMTVSLTHGWRKSWWTILGQQIALLTQIIIAAAGLGAIVSSMPHLFNTIRYAGAAYLVFLGLKMILHKPKASQKQAASTKGDSNFKLLQRGFWVNMSNPKAIVFLLAFMPLFIRPELPQLPQYLIFTATLILGDIVVMWGGFAVAAKSLTKLASSTSGQRILNMIFGSLFILVAALLALGGK